MKSTLQEFFAICYKWIEKHLFGISGLLDSGQSSHFNTLTEKQIQWLVF